jgi:hypothetical protein
MTLLELDKVSISMKRLKRCNKASHKYINQFQVQIIYNMRHQTAINPMI